MFSDSYTKDGLSRSKVDACGICTMRVKANTDLCEQCGKWIHSRCAGVKRVTSMFSTNFACRKCEGNIGEAVEQDKKICDEVETVKEFTYLGDMVSAGGGCEAVVTAKTKCGWVMLRECSELLW